MPCEFSAGFRAGDTRRRGTSVTITAPLPTALRVTSGVLAPAQASGVAPSSATSATSNGTAGRDSPTVGAHSSAVNVLSVGFKPRNFGGNALAASTFTTSVPPLRT